MSRAVRPALGLALAMVLLACGGGDTLRTETGVVLDVQAQGLASISGFTLRTADGRQLRFDTTGTRFDAAGFPPEHLQEHRALAEPIKVTFQTRDGVNAVVKLEDAAP